MKNNIQAKILRTVFSILPISKKRQGACIRCGKCCHLPSRCKFLRCNDSGKAYCSVYKLRPPSCRKYPRSEKEILTDDSCGYWF